MPLLRQPDDRKVRAVRRLAYGTQIEAQLQRMVGINSRRVVVAEARVPSARSRPLARQAASMPPDAAQDQAAKHVMGEVSARPSTWSHDSFAKARQAAISASPSKTPWLSPLAVSMTVNRAGQTASPRYSAERAWERHAHSGPSPGADLGGRGRAGRAVEGAEGRAVHDNSTG